MLRDLKSSVIAVVVLTLVFGLAIPALFTGFAQLAFSSQADGSLIKVNGKVVGSRLAAQAFTKPQYFHERPSATAPAYNAGATTFANLGPTNPDLAKSVKAAGGSDPQARAPVQPGHDDPRHPGRRGHDLRLGHRPGHLARLRAAAGAPRREPCATCRSRGSSS